MAVLWQRKKNNTTYEIRTAGATVRLYKNGVCHSQYNPKRILTGSVWDLLFIPSFFLQKKEPLKILVLGVGGGAVLRLFEHFYPGSQITGVELDSVHVSLGKKYFGLMKQNISVYQADARQWVQDCEPETYDIVIEDLFSEQAKQPVRAVAATSSWYTSLLQLLRQDGLLIMNFASINEFRQSAALRTSQINHGFHSIFQLTTPTLDNVIGVYSKHPLQSDALHAALLENKLIKKAIETKYLRYRIRKLRKL